MATIKRSRQREAIKEFLKTRKDHPTADTIYQNIRKEYPNISLGTVYRNLSLLTELGEIQKLSCGTDSEHYDGETTPHHHFICNKCHAVIDLEMESINHICLIAGQNFDGEIESYVTYFYGTCNKCLNEK